MRLLNILLIPIGILLLCCATACTRENLDDCPETAVLDLSFSFTKNVSGEDKFTSEVNRLDLFVFNQEGLYVRRVTATGPFQAGYRLSVELPIGNTYTLVAWGDLSDSYTENQNNADGSLSPLVMNQSTFDNARLALAHVDYEVKQPIQVLFHGSVAAKIDRRGIHQTAHIALTKNTNVVRTTVIGIQQPTLGVSYSGANGRFCFDNAIADDSRFGTYLPYLSNVVEGRLQTEITLPRLMIDRRIDIAVVDNPPVTGRSGTVLYRENLIGLLKDIPEIGIQTQDDLDRRDEYDLTLDVSKLPFQISITINGWTIVRILGTID